MRFAIDFPYYCLFRPCYLSLCCFRYLPICTNKNFFWSVSFPGRWFCEVNAPSLRKMVSWIKTQRGPWAIKVILKTCLRPTWQTFYSSSSFGHKIGCGSTWRPHRSAASRANQHPPLCWAVLTIHLTWPKRQICHSGAATHFYSPRSNPVKYFAFRLLYENQFWQDPHSPPPPPQHQTAKNVTFN